MITNKRIVSKLTLPALKLQAIGNPYRLAILHLLLESPLTPSKIATLVGLTASLTIHHLNILLETGWLTKSTKIGREVTYTVSLKPLKELKSLLPHQI